MQSMTDPSAKIKASLMEKTEELIDYIANAVHEGTSVHEVEKALWSKMLDMGYNAMELYLKSLGDGNAGATTVNLFYPLNLWI